MSLAGRVCAGDAQALEICDPTSGTRLRSGMRYYLLNLYLRRVLAAVFADSLCFLGAAALTWSLLQPPFELRAYALASAGGALGAFLALYYTGAYGLTVLGNGRRTFSGIVGAMGLAFVAALFLYFAVRLPAGATEAMAHVSCIYFPMLLVERFVFRAVSAHPGLDRRVLVIGASDLGLAIARALRDRQNLGIRLVGFLSDEVDHEYATLEGIPVLGKAHELEKIIERRRVTHVVVASKSRSEFFPAAELLAAKLRNQQVMSGIDFYERVTGRVYLRDLRPSYLIFADGFHMGPLGRAVKRSLDVVLSALGLALAAPVLAVCAVAIRLSSPGPVFYRQQRVGRGGRLFEVVKLRSMRHGAEDETGPVWTGEGDERVTAVGRWLRKVRLDEVPQLWNVLVGDMSLVGPRPERPEFVESLSDRYPYFRLRSALKPGITGWAQIRFGYANELAAFEEKLALDLYYMKHRSVLMDLVILWKTAKTVATFDGV